jgi:starch synthase
VKILYLASEVVPYSKTGGLADVAGALPKALHLIGHDVRIFTPRYKNCGSAAESELPVYFYEDQDYFGSRSGLYQENGVDYPDNLERFAAYCQAALPLVKELDWWPDIVHCNDWQSALVIAYLKVLHKNDPYFKRTATVYSIHNLAYLGLFPKEKMPATGLGPDQFQPAALEFWGKIALTKAGLVYADAINTVSETYAREIQTPEFGCGLDGLLRSRSADVYGVINGLDYEIWNPATDQNITKRFSPATLSLKIENKYALQKLNNLPKKKETPVIGMITRLADQKGFDLLSQVLDELMAEDCQLVILGTGDQKYHDLLQKAKKRYPDKIGVNLKFDALLAEMIYAGSDLFLMPSRYEPCGLGQLISFKYGTIPIVRKTGGLADTVHEFNSKSGEGEGFVFDEYTSEALFKAIQRALGNFGKPSVWHKLQEKVMRLDYSWQASAAKYIALYLKALAKIGISPL